MYDSTLTSTQIKMYSNKENRETLSYLGLFLVIPCYYKLLTGSVGEYPATPNIERGEINEVYNFVYSTDRFGVGFAPMVKSRDMARNWSQIFEIVCSTGDFHAQNEVVYFVYIRNSFLSRRLETFCSF